MAEAMDPVDFLTSRERRHFIKETIKYLQDIMSKDDLQRLVTEDEVWKALMSNAKLPRDEEAELHKSLRELVAGMEVEDRDKFQQQLQARKKFVEAFPRFQAEVEMHIGKLRALADHIDEVHRGCNISNVVSDSISVASGVLSILAILLAPTTAGVSLMLSTAGLGLGAAATVTSVATTIVEETSRQLDEIEASRHVSASMEIMREVVETVANVALELFFDCIDIVEDLECLGHHIRAIRLARANPRLLEEARLLARGEILPQGAEQVRSVFRNTAVVMSRRARIRGTVVDGVFLLKDLSSLMKNINNLSKGTQSEAAEKLRCLAQEMEEKLEKLTKVFRTGRLLPGK